MSSPKRQKTETKTTVDNYIGGKFVSSTSGKYLDVTSPHDGEVIGKVALSTAADVDTAVKNAEVAFAKWSALTVKARAQIMLKLHALIRDNADELADMIVKEHGKTKAEALGDVAKGNETVEYACSMPQLIAGRVLEVSRGVECRSYNVPLGVVASIVPFNFPAMVPFWTIPIALACGNCVILKPSEKVPMTFNLIVKYFEKAGFPEGVFQIVNGQADAVNAICDNPGIKAVSFVGSSKIAELVSKRCRNLNKRCLALGGAKNHLVALQDCNVEMTASDVVNSYSGCAGQRCMAASVLLTVGPNPKLIERIIEKSKALKPGSGPREIGPIIDVVSRDRIISYIGKDEHKILLDGRDWATKQKKGFWVGPSILQHTSTKDAAMQDEIFGPVLSIFECKSKEEAIAIENANPYGNAACVYTSNGGAAEWFTKRFSVGMVGINIGVPVPREPFSFGGSNKSSFGDVDVTADGAMTFFTKTKKVTQKWNPPEGDADWMS